MTRSATTPTGGRARTSSRFRALGVAVFMGISAAASTASAVVYQEFYNLIVPLGSTSTFNPLNDVHRDVLIGAALGATDPQFAFDAPWFLDFEVVLSPPATGSIFVGRYFGETFSITAGSASRIGQPMSTFTLPVDESGMTATTVSPQANGGVLHYIPLAFDIGATRYLGTATYFTSGGGFLSQIDYFEAPSAIPEPWTWALLIAGFASVGVTLRRQKAAAQV